MANSVIKENDNICFFFSFYLASFLSIYITYTFVHFKYAMMYKSREQ